MAVRARVRISPERLRVWRELLRVHALVTHALDRELGESRDLPLAWYDVLASLDDAGGRLRMQTLAQRVVFSRSGTTRLVDRMVAAGVVRRERCAADGRGTYAVLTPLGKRRLRDASGLHLRGVRDHFTRHLTEPDVRAMHEALRRILDAEGDDVD
jgi:DNA-binding MarR family transcriptional regulator